MRKIILCVIVLLLFISNNVFSQHEKNDSIRTTLRNFLISSNELSKGDDSDLMIWDIITHQEYEDGNTGIFSFRTLASEAKTHLVIFYKDRFEIVDMNKEYTQIINQLLIYLKTDYFYSKGEVLECFERVNEIEEDNSHVGWGNRNY